LHRSFAEETASRKGRKYGNMVEKLRIWVAVKHGIDVNLTRADRATGLVRVESAPRKTSDFDKNAVEEAVRIREKHGGVVTAISVGGPAAREALREAVAIGADEAMLVTTEAWAQWDTRAVARLLAAASRKLGGFDLFLLGEGSTDHFAGLVGPRLAGELGCASAGYARRLTVEPDGVLVERDLEKEVEVVRAKYPVVVTVGQEINTPRLPTFMANLKASKKEVRVVPPADLGIGGEDLAPTVVVERVAVPEIPRKLVTVSGASPDELASRLRDALLGEGVLP
jgi:electron transfer flavoprotein beta subunit